MAKAAFLLLLMASSTGWANGQVAKNPTLFLELKKQDSVFLNGLSICVTWTI